MNLSFKQLGPLLTSFVGQWYRWCALTVVGLVLLIGWLVVLRPEYRLIRDSGVISYQSSAQRLTTRQSHLADLQLLSERYAAVDSERLRQLDALLPTTADAPALIAAMERFAADSGTSLAGIDVSVVDQSSDKAVPKKSAADAIVPALPPLDHPGVHPITLAVTLTVADGLSYDELRALLNQIDQFVPLLQLDQLNYDPATTSISLQLTTYYFAS